MGRVSGGKVNGVGESSKSKKINKKNGVKWEGTRRMGIKEREGAVR